MHADLGDEHLKSWGASSFIWYDSLRNTAIKEGWEEEKERKAEHKYIFIHTLTEYDIISSILNKALTPWGELNKKKKKDLQNFVFFMPIRGVKIQPHLESTAHHPLTASKDWEGGRKRALCDLYNTYPPLPSTHTLAPNRNILTKVQDTKQKQNKTKRASCHSFTHSLRLPWNKQFPPPPLFFSP